MKLNRLLYGVAALMGVLLLGACSEDELDASQSLSVASFYPTIVMDGTEIEITGTALDQVTEVVFPGGKSTSAVTLVDQQLLKVVAPAGVSTEAESLILKTAGGEISSRQTIRGANPQFASYVYSDNAGAATYSALTISGSDLLLVNAVKLANDSKEITVPALLMIRKSNDAIKFEVPGDAPTGKDISVTLYFENGSTISLPSIEVKKGTPPGGTWVEKEVVVYDGDPVDTGGWSGYLQIAATDFGELKEGDIIRVYFTDADGSAQGSLKCTPGWGQVGEGLEYFNLTAEEKELGYYERPVTAEMLENLNGETLIVGGQKYVITKVTLMTTVWVEASSDLRDPITDATILLNDFEDDGNHSWTWDGSWTSGVVLDFPVDEEDGNTYLYLNTSIAGDIWLVNCNHKDFGTISNIENYTIKFDFKADEGVDASGAAMQFVLGNNWIWFGAGLFPATTDGKWITVSYNISDIDPDLTGDLKIGTDTNGIFGGTVPAGISIDNFRLDPKE